MQDQRREQGTGDDERRHDSSQQEAPGSEQHDTDVDPAAEPVHGTGSVPETPDEG